MAKNEKRKKVKRITKKFDYVAPVTMGGSSVASEIVSNFIPGIETDLIDASLTVLGGILTKNLFVVASSIKPLGRYAGRYIKNKFLGNFTAVQVKGVGQYEIDYNKLNREVQQISQLSAYGPDIVERERQEQGLMAYGRDDVLLERERQGMGDYSRNY